MQVIGITGNIGNDAQVNKISDDRVAINFSVCSNKTYVKKGGEKHSKATWFDCTIWAKEDKLSQYFAQGRFVSLKGEFENTTRTIQEEGKEGTTNIRGLYFNVNEFAFGDKQED